ncbi:MAG: NAD(P)/FAD-dependent oxidoreductase [Burkholderiaceae bacterium]|nr:NAD(P)/FAD-dependent oxidoreductase [Burkholderiaceae bacterium]
MAADPMSGESSPQPAEHFDVLIAGAGISGVGAAWHLRHRSPEKRFLVLESQDGFGGTWRTHRYPGIRSDSDLFTFGYGFKPWMGKPIATAEEILSYMGEVIDENDLAPHIRYRHVIERASWSGEEARWTVEGRRSDTGEPFRVTASFLWMCQGYYRHARGYTPDWPGTESFGGRIVHPQEWPDDLDLEGKRVVVIGSGATAATLVPAVAGRCAHVTMLQRSPTFFITGRNANELAQTLRELEIPDEWTHEIVRRKILFDQQKFTRRSFAEPETVKAELLAGVRAHLGEDFDIERHFTPSYRPWRQRIAFIPDGDLFRAVADGKASVVTDHIEAFDATGIRLASGGHLDADVVVTATGFDLSVLGDIAFTIDGQPLAFHETTTWRGTMFTGVPNMAWVFGYFRASWTLRSDLVAEFVCRLLGHMDARGAKRVVPRLRPEDADMPALPWVDEEDFNPGYINRGIHLLPKQGDRQPWRHTQDYWVDRDDMPAADLDDGLRYS